MNKVFLQLKKKFPQIKFEIKKESGEFGMNYVINLIFPKSQIITNEDLNLIQSVLEVFKIYHFELSNVLEMNAYLSKKFVTNIGDIEKLNHLIGKKINRISFSESYLELDEDEVINMKSALKSLQNLIDEDENFLEVFENYIINGYECWFEGEIEPSHSYLSLIVKIDEKKHAVSRIHFYVTKTKFTVISVYTLPKFQKRGFASILHKFIQDKTGLNYDTNLDLTKSGFRNMVSNKQKLKYEKFDLNYLKRFQNFNYHL
jgi:hypothetical protein